jgi:ankyrin repeat protein
MKTIEEMKGVLINHSENDFINELINYNIFEQDKFGNDIVHYLINYLNDNNKNIEIDFIKIIDILLEMGLDINTKQKKGPYQRTYLQLSVVINNRKIFDYLVEKGANVNSIDINGNTILHNAVKNYLKDTKNYEYYIRKLLEKGADPIIKNNYGINVIELVNSFKNNDIRKIFNEIKK